MQTQITHRCFIEEEIKEFGEKPLRRPPSGNLSTKQSIGIHRLARDPPSLIYSLYLSPPNFYSNTYSYNHSSKMKCKRVGKKNANTDNTPMCY